jgi:putative tricarboxylic transport membrane protein
MKVPTPILNTFIVVFCFLGAYALRNDMADVWLTMLFGVLGFFMRRWGLPVPPLVMGVILGPMAEAYFLTSMVSSGNDPSVFVTRPISATLLALSVLLIVWPLLRTLRRKRMLSGERSDGEEATP